MENKKQLIYAEDLLLAIRDDVEINGKNYAMVKTHIQNAPTVDAVEVVHGKWEEIGVADYKCSRCGFRFTSADPISMFQYCRCGAKMDGDGND